MAYRPPPENGVESVRSGITARKGGAGSLTRSATNMLPLGIAGRVRPSLYSVCRVVSFDDRLDCSWAITRSATHTTSFLPALTAHARTGRIRPGTSAPAV